MDLKIQLFFLVFSFASLSNSQDIGENFLLPNATKPELYALIITTNVPSASRRFTGILSLRIRVLESTNEIFLHSRQHIILAFNLYEGIGSEAVELANVSQTRENDNVIKFSSDRALRVGTLYDLHISYQGNLLLASDGFFRSDYVVNENGNDKFT